MAVQVDELPASSQLSSVLSDPPLSENEGLGEITVELHTTTISPSQSTQPHHDDPDTTNMPSKRSQSGAQPTRQSARQSKRKPAYRADSSEDELGKEIHVSPSVSKSVVPAKRGRSNGTTKPAPRPAAKKTKTAVDRKAKKWEPDFVTTNSKSPLVTNSVDLRVSSLHATIIHIFGVPIANLESKTLLLQPAAWDVLSADDKQEILSFFPANVHILDPNTPNARPNVTSLSSNDTFRHDAEEYVSNISKGMHDPEWLRQAWVAHQRRATGEFDEFYIRKVEVDWNTDIPYEHRPEHLRGTKKSGTSSVPIGEAPQLGSPVKTPEKDGASTNGNKAPVSDQELRNGAMNVADSITVHEKEGLKGYGGPRFELIPSPAQSDVERVHDSNDTVNGAFTDVTRADTIDMNAEE